MSLTEAEHAFAGLHEDAANDFLVAFFTARPRWRHFGSPSFVSATSLSATQIPAIQFPGIPGGIQWEVRFSVPIIDFYPDSSGNMLAPLTLDHGMFSVRTTASLRLGCMQREDDFGERPPSIVSSIKTTLQMWAVGHPTETSATAGAGSVGLELDAVEIVDIQPNSLEELLECLLRMMLQAVLDQARIPLGVISGGALPIKISRGPEIEDNEVRVWGDV